MTYIVSQVFGIGAFIVSLIAYHRKSKKTILGSMVCSNILNLIHYLLLGAYSGCITKVLAIFRDFFIILKEKYSKLSSILFLFMFIALYITASVLTYKGILSILPLLAALIYIIFIWNGSENRIKKVAFFCYFLWLIYNIFVLSIAGIISNIISIISTFIAIINARKKEINMDAKIRDAREEDLPDVVDIKIKGWQSAYKGIVDDTYLNNLSNEYDMRIEKMKNNYMEDGFIVAESDGKIVGFCRYVFDNNLSPEVEDADCEICAIYVKPDLKYSGIGTKMFKYVADEFKNKNKSKMILWCLKDNEASKKFYTKMGGKIIKDKWVTLGEKKYQECCFEYDV